MLPFIALLSSLLAAASAAPTATHVTATASSNSTRATGAHTSLIVPSVTLTEACALVSAASAAVTDPIPTVDIQIAVDCLNSVPVDVDGNIDLIDEIKQYLQLQTTLRYVGRELHNGSRLYQASPGAFLPRKHGVNLLGRRIVFGPVMSWHIQLLPVKPLQITAVPAYLKDPPVEYLGDSIDLLGSLDDLQDDLRSDQYDSEYVFQLDLRKLFIRARDGHLLFQADILQNAIQFGRSREVTLVSVSVDGKAVPKVYVLSDLQGNKTRSAVTQVDRQPIHLFLEDVADGLSQLQDPDASYNELFWRQASDLAGKPVRGTSISFSNLPVSAMTDLTFENGTTRSFANLAAVVGDFTGVVDGISFFQQFCNGSAAAVPADSVPSTTTLPSATTSFNETIIQTSLAVSTSLAATPTATSIVRHPEPNFEHSLGAAAGYFINGTGPANAAILSITTFLLSTTEDLVEFQNGVRDFLLAAVATEKEKLIIDLRGNPGGTYYLAYDLFRQLFPSIEPYGGMRLHSPPVYRDLIDIYSQAAANTSFAISTDLDDLADPLRLDYREDLNEQGSGFRTLADNVGPYSIHDDDFSAIVRLNITDVSRQGTLNITGSGNVSLPNAQLFKSENIVLLYDGICASTCAIFSEFMKAQGGVKSVAIGGRPQNGPMQGVGGTKGGQVLGFASIFDLAANASAIIDVTDIDVDTANIYKLINIPQIGKRMVPGSGQVNYRNNYRKGDKTQTPLQFVYEAADCRIWYTQKNIFDATETWIDVANAAWGKNDACVQGSKGAKGSLSSGDITISPSYGGVAEYVAKGLGM